MYSAHSRPPPRCNRHKVKASYDTDCLALRPPTTDTDASLNEKWNLSEVPDSYCLCEPNPNNPNKNVRKACDFGIPGAILV